MIQLQKDAVWLEWAQANDKLIDSAEFERTWQSQGRKGGGENQVVVSAVDQIIFKRNYHEKSGVMPYYADFEEYFDHVALHNDLFPETALFFAGFSETPYGLAPCVRQEFVRGIRGATRPEVQTAMEQRGFIKITADGYESKYLGLRVGDLHDQNVLIDYENNLRFIDPIIKRILQKEA